MRRRLALRIGELDQALTDKDECVTSLPPMRPLRRPCSPTSPDYCRSYRSLIAERLPELPPAELRLLFEALQLTATYHHDRKEVDIEITLHERGLDGAQVCPVPPVRFELTLWAV